jgi:hypothetical protein
MNKLRLEISVALLIKLLLLIALWLLIFRWQERPQTKPDIAAHFSLNTQAVTFSNP